MQFGQFRVIIWLYMKLVITNEFYHLLEFHLFVKETKKRRGVSPGSERRGELPQPTEEKTPM